MLTIIRPFLSYALLLVTRLSKCQPNVKVQAYDIYTPSVLCRHTCLLLDFVYKPYIYFYYFTFYFECNFVFVIKTSLQCYNVNQILLNAYVYDQLYIFQTMSTRSFKKICDFSSVANCFQMHI